LICSDLGELLVDLVDPACTSASTSGSAASSASEVGLAVLGGPDRGGLRVEHQRAEQNLRLSPMAHGLTRRAGSS
jgi:hypothetical protein